MAIKSVVPAIDELEAEDEAFPQPELDVILLSVPVPTYVALSDLAAKKNMTVAQLITRAFNLVLQES